MKILEIEYKKASRVIPAELIDGIKGMFADMNYNLAQYDIKEFKKELQYQLKMNGWSDKVRLSANSSISITGVQKEIGLCTQTGNVGRMYADLMKLQALYLDKKINAAIFIIPQKDCANSFGGNVANFERMYKELSHIFNKVITVPMVIIAFDNP